MAAPKILIVDDNTANLSLARMLLESEGYDIAVATDAVQALDSLRTRMPDLVLMDIQMPGMDGLELTRRLKRNIATRHIPILALTAYASEGDERDARAAGCDGYYPKPISTEQLPTVVRRYLAH